MKRIIILIAIAFAALPLALSCRREAPAGTEAFLLEFTMPEECHSNAFYAGQKVYLRGGVDYEFETDICGMVTVPSVVPGIYDIVTGMELTGAQYKALLKEPVSIEDNARVMVGVSLMNQKIFEAEDFKISLTAAVLKGLLISKVYYSGTRDNMDRTYTTDSYVEIFNNSDEVLYIDG